MQILIRVTKCPLTLQLWHYFLQGAQQDVPLSRIPEALVSNWGFLSLKISLFGCNIASAFSSACSFDLIFVHIWV